MLVFVKSENQQQTQSTNDTGLELDQGGIGGRHNQAYMQKKLIKYCQNKEYGITCLALDQ